MPRSTHPHQQPAATVRCAIECAGSQGRGLVAERRGLVRGIGQLQKARERIVAQRQASRREIPEVHDRGAAKIPQQRSCICAGPDTHAKRRGVINQKRAARQGFDWPDTDGPADKLREEMAELAEADTAHQLEEAGDLLFAAVNLVRAYGIAPEDALRAANAKFERRYRAMESLADCRFASLSLDEQEALWQAVKRSEVAKPA